MNIKTITLSKGYVALVDDEDYEDASRFKWSACEKGHNVYALRNIRINGKYHSLYLHRYLMSLSCLGKHIDHIDGNGLNNRRENLRLCTNTENLRNQHSSHGSSKYKGVSWHKRKKWMARIRVDGVDIYLGVYEEEEAAARAYDKAAKKHFGEFANLNFKI